MKKMLFGLAPKGTAIALACAIALSGGVSQAAELEEIVVTATKRAVSLQDVGMSLTALTGRELEAAGVEELLDFAVKVPNLGVAYEADGRFDSSSPAIRGVFGLNTTGFYIDDTQVTASLLPRVVDLERIEVLRGPQGSLYGARSMGGTIRLITKRPSLTETEGDLKVSLASVTDGDLNQSINASYSFPLVEDQIGVRISAYWGANSGVQDRVFQATYNEATRGIVRPTVGPNFGRNEDVDDETYYGGQITANIKINENLTFIPKIMMQKIDADGLPFADVSADNTDQLRFFDTEEPGTDEWVIASGTFDWDLGHGSIVSTTSFYSRETIEAEEEHTFLNFLFDVVIGIPIDALESQITTTQEYDSFIHETRYTSDFEGQWQVTGGFFYQDQEALRTYPDALQPGVNAAVNAFVGAPINIVPGDLIFKTNAPLDTKEIALFGEASYEFNEQWKVTAGGRWYDTEVEGGANSDGFANGGPTSFVESQNESGFNPRVVVEYQANDDLNLYASASKGFRVGGVNGNVPVVLCGAELAALGLDPSNATKFDSDELWSYELGVKSTLASNTVTLNAAVFFIDWTDIQQINRLACGFQFTDNAGEAESKGFELEVNAAPTDNLRLSLGVGYTDAEITDAGGVAGVTVGDKIQGVPDWTINGSASYDFDFNQTWRGNFRVDANHYGESFSSNNESSAATQRQRDSWETVNLRLTGATDKYEITLFIDNATDERANLADSRSIAAETPGRQRLVTNRPRTIGVQARMRFQGFNLYYF